MTRPRALLLMLALLAGAGVASAQVPAVPFGQHFRVEWQVSAGRDGRPVLDGYVHSDYGLPASDMRLLVETLDASGQTIAKTVGYVITGYVDNDNGLAHAKVRLLVESLDAAGHVTATTAGYVDSLVPLKGRAYFEVPVDRPGASYRVSVPYFDWIESRGKGRFLP